MIRLSVDGINIIRSPFKYVNANMYVIVENEEAVVIDPHKDEEVTTFLKDVGVKKILIIPTHEHHDHTSGIYWYQQNFESQLICQQETADVMMSKRYLHPMVISFILEEMDRKNGTHTLEEFKQSFVMRNYLADLTFDEEWTMNWYGHIFKFFHIPGHSKGSSLIILDDKVAFTGDSLIQDWPIITRFPGSNHNKYVEYTLPLLQEKLKESYTILPGHGKPFVLGEIMKKGHIDVQFK